MLCWEAFGLPAVSVNSHFVSDFLMWYLSSVFRLASIFACFTSYSSSPPQAKDLLNSSNRFKVHHKLRCGAKESSREACLFSEHFQRNRIEQGVPIHLPLTGQTKQHTSVLRFILRYQRNGAVLLSLKDQEVGFLQADSVCLVYSLSSRWVYPSLVPVEYNFL